MSRRPPAHPSARQGLEPWHPTRLNARLHHALHLAEVIVRHASFEPGHDGLVVTGFVVNMAKVFEDFLCAQLTPRLVAYGGITRTQDRCHLDVDRQVAMAPDLVWYADGPTPSAVIDAKYKAERPTGCSAYKRVQAGTRSWAQASPERIFGIE